ncbi:NADP-dependent 3-hydroxy acid dehydrogenase YdfG [Ilumatobacter fluminis]|uniref:NADP-dependent 3-hydroxy acid dehydrogenase YdfG n=1 Tax=Ilumatobacter fluminis TaxID=467091 RepID=A0A4R7HWQ3_9ACTN|nr:oxidoreductase [Ilumatobacter fluminis]TDT15537.1 NADP-dependent 3-hydroxy acid dehydrogenase YdfG [Ilumatobacter fluminis]
MSWTTNDIPDLSGKIAVVTGANGGLGLETSRALAAAGAHVVMAARNQDKAANARDDILAGLPDASLEIVELDLGSFESTTAAAATIVAAHPTVDIVVNNAGLMAMPERRTADGYEMQFGVNHLGHWIFTAGLLPSILAADAARVVTVSSTAHHMGRAVDPDNVNMEGEYSPWGAYGRAKLANLHFAIGLQREFERAGFAAQSLAAHPGLSNTDLQTHTVAEGGGGWMASASEWLASKTGMSADDGARSQLRAATDPNAKGGEFYGPRWVNNGAPIRKPIIRPGIDSAIEKLWLVSERETGVSIDVEAAAG